MRNKLIINKLRTIYVPEAGLEPARPEEHRIFLPTTAFAAPLKDLWSGLSLYRISERNLGILRQVSTLSVTRNSQSLARDCHQHKAGRFPRI